MTTLASDGTSQCFISKLKNMIVYLDEAHYGLAPNFENNEAQKVDCKEGQYMSSIKTFLASES